jgi:hypothetical protein
MLYLWYIGGHDLPTWLSTQMGTLRIHRCALNQMSSCSRSAAAKICSSDGTVPHRQFWQMLEVYAKAVAM